MTILREFDHMVDGRTDGVMKPDPRAYLLMAERMGAEPADCVFIDDQPGNLAGAEAVGMRTVHLDPVNPGPGFTEARQMLGLA
jgi:HAD superfamily hydrolase (TIGR01509 family)